MRLKASNLIKIRKDIIFIKPFHFYYQVLLLVLGSARNKLYK